VIKLKEASHKTVAADDAPKTLATRINSVAARVAKVLDLFSLRNARASASHVSTPTVQTRVDSNLEGKQTVCFRCKHTLEDVLVSDMDGISVAAAAADAGRSSDESSIGGNPFAMDMAGVSTNPAFAVGAGGDADMGRGGNPFETDMVVVSTNPFDSDAIDVNNLGGEQAQPGVAEGHTTEEEVFLGKWQVAPLQPGAFKTLDYKLSKPADIPPWGRGNPEPNRYEDILPTERTRFKLKKLGTDIKTTYINANEITALGACFIAAQGACVQPS
jgi:hypothetical protein